MKELILTAINASIQAGEEILKVYNTSDFNIELKSDNSPLTRADKNANKIITEYLKKTNIPILSEEDTLLPYEKRKHWKRFWLVDPLDGTKEFIKRNGEFTVNIALIENNKPIMGVIFVPVTGELYFGNIDFGAYKINLGRYTFNNINHSDLEIFITDEFKLPIKAKNNNFTVVGSRSHLSKETKQYFENLEKQHGKIDIIIKGSSLKMCMVAEGKADIYPRFGPTMEWDTGAGHAIVISAGGTFTKSDGSEFIYNKENLLNPNFIVKKS